MPDTFTTTTSQNYFQRLGNSFVGVLVGAAMIVGACFLLFWNDGRAVEAERALNAGARAVVSLEQPNPSTNNEGALIHVTGAAKATAPLSDPDTGITMPNVLMLNRSVEMFQWVEKSRTETREKLGGTQETTTVYTYEKQWSSSPVDSTQFAQPSGHENPSMPFRGTQVYAQDVTLGSFKLSEPILSKIDARVPAIPEATPKGWDAVGNQFFKGKGTLDGPQIGDLKMSYQVAPSPTTISIVGRQSGVQIEQWSNKGSNYRLLMVADGVVPADAMFKQQEENEQILTWILRAVGTLLNVIGFMLIMGPLKAIGNVIPFVASFIGAGTGIIAFALGLPLSLLIIALAWLAFRPLIGGALIAIAIATMIWLGGKGKGTATAKA